MWSVHMDVDIETRCGVNIWDVEVECRCGCWKKHADVDCRSEFWMLSTDLRCICGKQMWSMKEDCEDESRHRVSDEFKEDQGSGEDRVKKKKRQVSVHVDHHTEDHAHRGLFTDNNQQLAIQFSKILSRPNFFLL